MILFAIVTFDKTTPFPSAWALFPVVGSALIVLFAREDSLVGRFLSLPPMVGIGLISYSVYMWHQPMITFARLTSPQEPGIFFLTMMALLSFPIGYLSWRFIEQPVRQGPLARRMGQAAVFWAAGMATVAVIAIGLSHYLTNGMPNRTTPAGQSYADLRIEERIAVNAGLDLRCSRGFTMDARCTTGEDPTVLVWGDSYAMHIVGAVRAALPRGMALRQMTLSSCGPTPGITLVSSAAETTACARFNDQVVDWLQTDPGIDTVVLSSPFAWLATPTLTLVSETGVQQPGGLSVAIQTLDTTITRLRDLGLNVIVIAPPPNPGWDIGRCLVHQSIRGYSTEPCDFNRDMLSESSLLAYQILAGIEDQAAVIWPDQTICHEGVCRASVDDVFVYRDRGHLSNPGSQRLGGQPPFSLELARALGTQ